VVALLTLDRRRRQYATGTAAGQLAEGSARRNGSRGWRPASRRRTNGSPGRAGEEVRRAALVWEPGGDELTPTIEAQVASRSAREYRAEMRPALAPDPRFRRASPALHRNRPRVARTDRPSRGDQRAAQTHSRHFLAGDTSPASASATGSQSVRDRRCTGRAPTAVCAQGHGLRGRRGGAATGRGLARVIVNQGACHVSGREVGCLC